MNKFIFQVIVLLSVMHSATTSMMVSKKIGCGAARRNRLQSNNAGQTDFFEKIAQSLQNVEEKLEKQNRLLQDLQMRAYAFQVAQMESENAKNGMYDSHPSIEWDLVMKSVRTKTKE